MRRGGSRVCTSRGQESLKSPQIVTEPQEVLGDFGWWKAGCTELGELGGEAHLSGLA